MIRFLMKFVLSIVLLTQYSILMASEALQYNFNYTLIQEDNIKRGFYGYDVQDGQIQSIGLAATKEFELTALSVIFLNAKFENDSYDKYEKLSSNKLSAQLDYVFQTGFHFANPLYTLSFALEESDYDSNLRDSTTISLAAKLLKRLTTRIKFSTGLSYKVREADTNVFDITTTAAFLLLDYKATKNTSLYAMYQLQDGYSVSTVTTTDPDQLAQQIGYATINEADAAGALLPDDAYGGAANGQFAYRNAAQHAVFEYGINYSINAHHAVDLSAQTVTTTLNNGKEYENFLLFLSYLARF